MLFIDNLLRPSSFVLLVPKPPKVEKSYEKKVAKN